MFALANIGPYFLNGAGLAKSKSDLVKRYIARGDGLCLIACINFSAALLTLRWLSSAEPHCV